MGARSSEWIKDEEEPGGAEGDRTPDLHTASVALSQLSYSPDRRVWYQTAGKADNSRVGSWACSTPTSRRMSPSMNVTKTTHSPDLTAVSAARLARLIREK